MTTQQLSDLTKEFGHRIDRTVIAKLERGYRGTVTVAEVLVLARALRVPPALLVFPVGDPVQVEVLPGAEVEPWAGAKWWAGIMTTPERWGDGWDYTDPGRLWKGDRERFDVTRIVPAFQAHDQRVDEWRNSRSIAAQARHRVSREELAPDTREALLREADAREENAHQWERSLAFLRSGMREHGLIPPPLPPELLHLDDEQGGHDGEA